MIRWCLHLATFDYDIQYRASDKVAHVDYLSRAPLPDSANDEEVIPAGIHLLEAKDIESLSAADIAHATKKGTLLSKVLQWTQQEWPQSFPDEAKTYRKKDELSVISDCIIWHDRVVIPPSLRSRVLQLVHSTHLGETFSKSVARSSVWWPGIDEDVRNSVRQCVACQLAASSPPRTSISPWPAPNSAWAGNAYISTTPDPSTKKITSSPLMPSLDGLS